MEDVPGMVVEAADWVSCIVSKSVGEDGVGDWVCRLEPYLIQLQLFSECRGQRGHNENTPSLQVCLVSDQSNLTNF